MDITSQHPWQVLVLAPLTAEQIGQALADDDPQWGYIDSQMVKLGSLAHATLDIHDLQQKILTLLAEKSKDFRLLTHLLRTLQHAGKPDELLLAVSLLTSYVQNFWTDAWPQNPLHKRRFAQQVLKRFALVSGSFVQTASEEQRETLQGLLAHLAQVWHSNEPALAKEVDGLRIGYARQPEPVVERANTGEASKQESAPQSPLQEAFPVAEPKLDHSSGKAWRQTLLKMADLIGEQQPEAAMGFRLRRYAIWGGLIAPPMAQADGRTPLAAVSADRTADYQSRIVTADMALWQQVEQSLTLAPYWFDGHLLSAQIALRLGHENIARAIRDELSDFLTRLPALKNLFFSDMTPFLSAETTDWLRQEAGTQGSYKTIEQDEIRQCYQQQGLEAALQLLDRQSAKSEPRERFYHQLQSAQLLETAGLTTLAQQQYHSLLQVAQQLQLSAWEPTLTALLEEKRQLHKL